MATRSGSVDLRNLFGPIRDQGMRPTCLAFASSAAHERVRHRLEPLSPEALFHGCVRRDPPARYLGATVDVMTAAIQQDGQCDETQWPYGQRTPSNSPTFYLARPGERGAHDISGFVQSHLSAGQPAILALVLTDAWESVGSDGIVPVPAPTDVQLGGHAVLAVGYDTARQLTLARNSWGTTWGDAGYVWLPYAYLDAYAFDALTLEASS